MNWIALKMLTGDRSKYFGIVFGVTFATVLIAQQVSIFLIAAILGGATLQWPLGRLSDKFDRRRLLTAAAFASAALAVAAMIASTHALLFLILAAFLCAGTSMPLYSLCVAHTNDFLKPEQMVGASGTLMLLYGIGAIGGPFTNGALMSWIGPRGYWAYLAAGYLLLGLFALYRMSRRAAPPPQEQAPLATMPEAMTPPIEAPRE